MAKSPVCRSTAHHTCRTLNLGRKSHGTSDPEPLFHLLKNIPGRYIGAILTSIRTEQLKLLLREQELLKIIWGDADVRLKCQFSPVFERIVDYVQE